MATPSTDNMPGFQRFKCRLPAFNWRIDKIILINNFPLHIAITQCMVTLKLLEKY